MASEPDISTSRRMIIHCGVPKTGSTSLHHFVGRNQTKLAGRITVLTPVKGSATRNLGRTAMQFSVAPTPEMRARLVEVVVQLRDQLVGGTDTVLISHENILGAMIGKDGVTTLYPRMDEILAILNDGFAPLSPEFVVYTRDMADWKHSVYGQAVRSDVYLRTRAEFLDETRECGTWDRLEQRMIAQVGAERVRFFRLEDETEDRRPAAQLLRHAGLTDTDIAALDPLGGRSNKRLNAGALEFLRQVNGLGLDRKSRGRVADLVAAQQSLFAPGAM